MSAWLLLGAALAADPLATWSLDGGDGGLVSYGDTTQWVYGSVSTGPGGGYTGSDAWCTGYDRPYYNDSTDYLELPSVDLTGAARPVLSFYHWYEIDSGGDAGWIETWDGASWSRVEPVYGYSDASGYVGASNGWHAAYVDLSGLSDASSVRFVFSTDARVALSGWFLDDLYIVDGDPVPPHIAAVTVPTDTEDIEGPYPVEVNLEDDLGAVSAQLYWSETGEDPVALSMEEVSPGLFRGEIPGADPDTDLSWQVIATDGTNTATWPDDGPDEFRVYLAAPTGLSGPSGRVVGTTATLSWTAPDSSHDIIGYRVYRDGELVAQSVDTTEDAPLRGPVDTFEVSALYDVGEGDRSAPLLLHTEVPTIDLVQPAKAWQGDEVRVAIMGDYLLLSAADADLDLGDDVDVLSVEVVDANSALFTLSIAEDALEGLRDGELVSGDVRVALPDGFTVLPYADRPRLVSVSPSAVEQGDEVDLTLEANLPLVASPLVDLGDGVIVESVDFDGERVFVHASVAWTAEVGLHDVAVDDGSRVIEGVQLRVRNASTTPSDGCSTAPGPERLGALGLIALILPLSRRSRRGEPPRR